MGLPVRYLASIALPSTRTQKAAVHHAGTALSRASSVPTPYDCSTAGLPKESVLASFSPHDRKTVEPLCDAAHTRTLSSQRSTAGPSPRQLGHPRVTALSVFLLLRPPLAPPQSPRARVQRGARDAPGAECRRRTLGRSATGPASDDSRGSLPTCRSARGRGAEAPAADQWPAPPPREPGWRRGMSGADPGSPACSRA